MTLQIMNDAHLADLRRLRNDSLSLTAQQAKSEFQYIPHQIEATTREARLGEFSAIRRAREIRAVAISSTTSYKEKILFWPSRMSFVGIFLQG